MSAASDASSFASRLDDLASRLEGIDLYSEVSSIVTDLGELASASSDCADAVAARVSPILTHERRDTRLGAAMVFARLPSRCAAASLPALIDLIAIYGDEGYDGDTRGIEGALKQGGVAADPDASARLIAMLPKGGEATESARSMAMYLLTHVDDDSGVAVAPASVAAVASVLDDVTPNPRDDYARASAARCIGDVEPTLAAPHVHSLARALTGPGGSLRFRAADAFGSRAGDAVDAEIIGLIISALAVDLPHEDAETSSTSYRDFTPRDAALKALGHLKNRTVETVSEAFAECASSTAELFSSPFAATREAAARAAPLFGDACVEALLELACEVEGGDEGEGDEMGDNEAATRAAVEACASAPIRAAAVSRPDLVEALVERITDDPNPSVGAIQVAGLWLAEDIESKSEDEEEEEEPEEGLVVSGVNAISSFLESANPEQRAASITALASIAGGASPSGRAVARARSDSVAAAFQDEVETVRSAAVAAIGALDSKFEYGDQLAEVAFGDVDAHVRREALTALKAYE